MTPGVIPVTPANDLERAAQAAIHATFAHHEVQPLAAEQRLLLADLAVSGTFDLLGLRGDTLALIDFKTSRDTQHVRAEHRLQQAAYREALHRLGFPPMESWILAIDRDTGEPAWHQLPADHRPDFEAFARLAEVARWHRAWEDESRPRAPWE